ncbi:MAG: citrate (Si)-synthase, partial [Zetaproteobacteria bacterium CG23_combo_of_CG06-09_8_20_14_all_54_7]
MTKQYANIVVSDTQTPNGLPILKGSIGPDAVDVRTLLGRQNLLTYDPGFRSTASCESAITYIDGEAGQLLYRGYPIEELATRCGFSEVAHLLMYGELPASEQLSGFQCKINEYNLLHDQVLSFYHGFRRDAHPMAVMVGVVGALSAFYQDSQDYSRDEDQH